MCRTLSPGDSIWKICSKEAGEEVRLYTSLQQGEQAVWTAKNRCQVKEFSIVCLGRCEAPGSLASCLSHAPQLSGVNAVSLFTWLRAFPSFSAITDGAGGRCVWKHPLDHSLGGPHSHLEARNHSWLWYILSVDMAGDLFILQW